MFTFVYILQSKHQPDHYYVGMTTDLKARLATHNQGEVRSTARYRPWIINTAIAFRDRERATAFERYLKTASGRAFSKKRL